MNIIIITIITAILALYIVLPFFRKKAGSQSDVSVIVDNAVENTLIQRINALDNQKETLYSAIKDIEFDYSLGKLSSDDFNELNTKYKMEAAELLKEIDNLKTKTEISVADNKLEQEILSYRKSSGVKDSLENELEKEIAAFKTTYSTVAGKLCPQCGSEYGAQDVFCSKCGVKLERK